MPVAPPPKEGKATGQNAEVNATEEMKITVYQFVIKRSLAYRQSLTRCWCVETGRF